VGGRRRVSGLLMGTGALRRVLLSRRPANVDGSLDPQPHGCAGGDFRHLRADPLLVPRLEVGDSDGGSWLALRTGAQPDRRDTGRSGYTFAGCGYVAGLPLVAIQSILYG